MTGAREQSVEGRLTPEGTLELDHKPELEPGCVRVTVTAPAEDRLGYLQRCRAELEASGAEFRSGWDIAGDIEAIRGETERVDGLRWEQEWTRHHPGDPSC
jgi:hypothetical protein